MELNEVGEKDLESALESFRDSVVKLVVERTRIASGPVTGPGAPPPSHTTGDQESDDGSGGEPDRGNGSGQVVIESNGKNDNEQEATSDSPLRRILGVIRGWFNR